MFVFYPRWLRCGAVRCGAVRRGAICARRAVAVTLVGGLGSHDCSLITACKYYYVVPHMPILTVERRRRVGVWGLRGLG